MKAEPLEWELRIENVASGARANDLIDRICNDTNDLGRHLLRQGVARPLGGLIEPVGVDFAVRVTADFDDIGIF